jgi:hypothetical protein
MRMNFPLSTLWHIFVANIVNADTNLAATRVLESHERLGSLNTNRSVGRLPLQSPVLC